MSIVDTCENKVIREDFFINKEVALMHLFSEFDKWNIEPYACIRETGGLELHYFFVVNTKCYSKPIRKFSVFPKTVDDTSIEEGMSSAEKTKGERLHEYYNFLISKYNK